MIRTVFSEKHGGVHSEEVGYRTPVSVPRHGSERGEWLGGLCDS